MTHPTLAHLMAQTARLLKDRGADRWLAPEAIERAQALAAATLRNLPGRAGVGPGAWPSAGAAPGDVVDVEAREVGDAGDAGDKRDARSQPPSRTPAASGLDPRAARGATGRSGGLDGVGPSSDGGTAASAGRVDGAGETVEEPAAAASAAPAAPSASVDATAAPAVGASPARWVDGHFAHAVRAIEYRLHVPAGADDAGAAPRPLVLMLHGCTQDPRDFATGTAMHAAAVGAFVLYPAQSARANAQRCWNWFKHHHQQRGRGEALLLSALVQDVAARYPVDTGRIAVAGLSAGGAMAAVLGQAYPEQFSAVGVHSGLPAGVAADLPAALAAMRSGPGRAAAALPAVPTIVFHGDADTTVHPSNGRLRAAPAGAGADRRTSPQGVTYTRRVVTTGDGAPGHEEWVIHGAGHAWSGGAATGSYTLPAGPDASAAMWSFFERAWRGRGA